MALERCSPNDVRRSLVMVESLKQAGIGFIPMPYATEKGKQALIAEMKKRLELLEQEAE